MGSGPESLEVLGQPGWIKTHFLNGFIFTASKKKFSQFPFRFWHHGAHIFPLGRQRDQSSERGRLALDGPRTEVTQSMHLSVTFAVSFQVPNQKRSAELVMRLLCFSFQTDTFPHQKFSSLVQNSEMNLSHGFILNIRDKCLLPHLCRKAYKSFMKFLIFISSKSRESVLFSS